jgi:predicted alpha/beta hydrolase family esterase
MRPIRSSPARHAGSAHPRLVVPGLHGSGPTHWQSWLEARHAGSRRMQVGDWTPQLDDWADCLEQAYQSGQTPSG